MKRPRGICAAAKAQRAVNKQAGCCCRINPWSCASLLIAVWTNKEHILYFFSFFSPICTNSFPQRWPVQRADVLSFQVACVSDLTRSGLLASVSGVFLFRAAHNASVLDVLLRCFRTHRCEQRQPDSFIIISNKAS